MGKKISANMASFLGDFFGLLDGTLDLRFEYKFVHCELFMRDKVV